MDRWTERERHTKHTEVNQHFPTFVYRGEDKIKRYCQDVNIGVYHFVSRTKTRDKVAAMYNIQIIYGSKKNTLERI